VDFQHDHLDAEEAELNDEDNEQEAD
jgi:hypothetical protein